MTEDDKSRPGYTSLSMAPYLSWRSVWPVTGSGCFEHLRHPGVGCSWPAALRGALELSAPGA